MPRRAPDKYVGIDVSCHELHVAIDDASPVVFANTSEGHKLLLSKLFRRGKNTVHIVVEATGVYHLDLALALASKKRCALSVVNPRHSKRFLQAQGRRAKTDKVDSIGLMEMARSHQVLKLSKWSPPASHQLELRGLVRYHQQLVDQRAQLLAQLHGAEATGTTPQLVLKQLRKRLADTEKMAAEMEEAMADFCQQHDELKTGVESVITVPGIGQLTAIRLVSEFCVLDPEMRGKEIVAWAGLDPRPRESGTSVQGRRAISRQGQARIRHWMYMPTLSCGRVNSPLRLWMLRIVERSGKRKVGIIALMRKLLVVSWSTYRSGETWKASKARPRRPEVA